MPCEGNFPGPRHYSSWNLNMNTNVSAWPFNDGNYHNGALLLPSPDQHLVQRKEVAKQTMLYQEAVVRDQIRELHRIYWRQRDLMDEMKKNESLKHHPQRELMDQMKKNESLKHHLQPVTLQSNPFLPQDLCDYAQKTSHVLRFSGVNQFSTTTTENDQSLSDDRKLVLSGSDRSQSEFSLKGCKLKSSKKFGKELLDLELLPTEYIDIEDEESLQKVPEVSDHPLNRISEAVHRSDWQPDHGSCSFNSVFLQDNLNPGSFSSEKKFFADLNEPIKLEENCGTVSMYLPDLNEPQKNDEEVPAASKFLVDLNEPVELQEEAALSSDFQSPLSGHTDSASEDLAQKSNSGSQVPSTDIKHSSKSGRVGENCSNDLHMEKSDNEAGKRSSGVASSSPGFMNQKKKKTCSAGKDLSSNCNSVPFSTCGVGTSSQQMSPTDIGNSKPSSVIIVHALPCSNSSLRLRKHSKSSATSPGFAGKTSCRGKGLKLEFEDSGPTNFAECSMEVKSVEYIDSNFMSRSSSTDGERKLEDTERGLAWPKSKSLLQKRRRGRRPKSSIPVQIHQHPSEDELIIDVADVGVGVINTDCDPVHESGEQIISDMLVVEGGLDPKNSCFGAGIDLSFCIEDDETSPKPPLSTELGLEGPVSPENKESSPPRGDSDEIQVETSSELSGKEDGEVQDDVAENSAEAIVSGEEDVNLQEELSRNAATALVSISSSVVQECTEMAACEPSEPCKSDDLYWFANIVSSLVVDPVSELGLVLSSTNNSEYEDGMFNGIDYFEAMTLNLVETNIEQVDRFRINDLKGKEEEATGATYLPSQQRKGRIRRGRKQQKDFQSEILPSLSSLSRCEVTKDLHTIERQIKAGNGNQRETVYTRSMTRNGRRRGRKRSCISTSNLTDVTIYSSSKRYTSIAEKDVEESRLVGWGRVTRRRRGPRSPSANPWVR